MTELDPATWRIPGRQRSLRGEVELYLDRSSALAGDQVGVHVSSDGPVRLSVWRLGCEGAHGARLVADLGKVPSRAQASPTFQPSTGLVSCAHWPATTVAEVGSDWSSGVYAFRADTTSQPTRSADAILVVTPNREHDVVVILPVTTWAAYNAWGGRSLYDGGGFTGLPRAVQVSFDRPMKPTGSPIWELTQGHPVFTWEYPLVRWVERQGFDVAYVTNLELARGHLPARRLVVSAGHDEYWSTAMRDTLDLALGSGRSLFWAGANGMCWNIRLEPSIVGPNRVLTCYKDPLADPVTTERPAQATSRWGEWPLHRSESDILGVRWVDWDFSLNRHPAGWIARATDHPLFAGTGFTNGDVVHGVVGDEWDALDTTSPVASRGVILGESEPLLGANLGSSRGHSFLYRHDGGGLVMATGTTSWCWGLDATTVEDRATAADPRLSALTRSFFDAAIDGVDW